MWCFNKIKFKNRDYYCDIYLYVDGSGPHQVAFRPYS